MAMNNVNNSLKQFAGDATSFFNRAVQFTSEQIAGGEKTEYDSQLASLIRSADRTKEWTEKIVYQAESLIQPNPALRAEAFVNSVFDRKVPEHMTVSEQLGCYFEDAALDVGQHTNYGSILKSCGLTERKLGAAERKWHREAQHKFVMPLKAYLNTEMAAMMREKKILETKRLDLDVAKNKVRKCVKPVDMPTCEAGLKVCQDEFDRQAEVVRLMMSEIPAQHNRHQSLLRDFVQLQTQYYHECVAIMTELDAQLTSTPPQPHQSQFVPPAYAPSVEDHTSSPPFNNNGYLSFN